MSFEVCGRRSGNRIGGFARVEEMSIGDDRKARCDKTSSGEDGQVGVGGSAMLAVE